MVDRTELLESALDSLAEGMALAGQDSRVTLWNRAAENITGYPGREMVGQSARGLLDALVVGGARHLVRQANAGTSSQFGSARRGSLLHVRHKLGHEMPVMARILVLRDGLGTQIGSGIIFHLAETIAALPHGEISEDSGITRSQAETEDRLAAMHEDFLSSDIPLGVLWVTVDQARGLRRTHGAPAVEAMLEKMERTLACGLKPSEEVGRWGDDEFLVLSHERNAATLAAHAQLLAGMARTTNFRWWGDRISLTVSIGVVQAQPGEGLGELLERAQAAMLTSVRAGGNHITAMHGRSACSPS